MLAVIKIETRNGLTPAATEAAAANWVPMSIGPKKAIPYMP
jgi:hypothetical protein